LKMYRMLIKIAEFKIILRFISYCSVTFVLVDPEKHHKADHSFTC
jgi:hypothetical protein